MDAQNQHHNAQTFGYSYSSLKHVVVLGSISFFHTRIVGMQAWVAHWQYLSTGSMGVDMVRRYSWLLLLCLTVLRVEYPTTLSAQKNKTNRNNAPVGLDPRKELSQYVIKHKDKSDGLPQSTVYDLLLSKQGYLWVATGAGLARFDGRTFRHFDASHADEVSQAVVYDLHESADSAIWAATANGALRYKNGRFERISHNQGIRFNHLTSVTTDKQGVWLGSLHGLYHMVAGRVTLYGKKDGLPDDHISALITDRQGNVWIGSRGGLSIYKNGSFTTFTAPKTLPSNAVTTLYEDKAGLLWVGTESGLVALRDGKPFLGYGKGNGLSDNYINKIIQDSIGTYFIATKDGGLNRILPGGKIDKLQANDKLNTNRILSVCADREGGIWFGTYLNGLFNLTEGKFSNFTKENGLPDQTTTCILQDSSGAVWIGTVNGGAARYQNGVFTTYTAGNDALPGNYIRTIYQDREGTIWFGVYGYGLSKLFGRTFVTFTAKDGLTDNYIRCLTQDATGALWIGGSRGLTRYRNGDFVKYNTAVGLSANSVLCLHTDKQGTIWIGTEGGKLNFTKDGSKFYTVAKEIGDVVYSIYEDPQGVLWIGSDVGIHRISIKGYKPQNTEATVTPKAATEDNADKPAQEAPAEKPAEATPEAPKEQPAEATNTEAESSNPDAPVQFTITTYTYRDGLPSVNAYEIIEDDRGNLWVTSSKGVYRVSKADLESYPTRRAEAKNNDRDLPEETLLLQTALFGEHDGMVSSECASFARPAACMALDGKLWIPTVKGIAVMDPAKVRTNTMVPPVVIEELIVNGTSYPTESGLSLAPGANRFQFVFTALSMLHPEGMRFRYRLEGEDTDWIDANGRREAFYTNLSPGTYTFRVIACNSDGIWNEAGASFTFTLEPAYYQTRWFWALCIGLLVLGAVSFYRWRVRVLRLRASILERTVKARTQEIRLHVEELETLDRMVQIINRETDLAKLLDLVLSQIFTLFSQAEKGAFLLLDPQSKRYRFEAVHGYATEASPIGESLRQTQLEAFLQKATFNHENVGYIFKGPVAFYEQIKLSLPAPASMLALIIDVEGAPGFGVMLIENFTNKEAFSKAVLLRLLRFRTHAATAFEKARTLAIIRQKSDNLEDAYGSISDSITYAKRIQEAILPPMVRIREAFPESFIFFRPRDIVSGDFYWLHTEGDYKMIAAVDCTGHGVPGAFMSVIGSTLLSQIVEEQNVTDPGEILGRLNREVKRRLNQNAPDAKTNDGMDAALCVIKGNTVLFAGANRPLFVVSSNGVLTEVAGAKAPIGGRFSLQDQVYTTHEIEFNAGDSLYLTSDGYADQFGGPERRKFMNKRLKELLTAISRLPAETQYICIAETMDSWQGSNRQLDDILVIGIKG